MSDDTEWDDPAGLDNQSSEEVEISRTTVRFVNLWITMVLAWILGACWMWFVI